MQKAVELIAAYNGEGLLQHYLKRYFAENRQHGSKDRKAITHYCYSFFRIGKNLPDLSLEERLKVALFLCDENTNSSAWFLPEAWQTYSTASPDNKIDFIRKIYPDFKVENIFPFQKQLVSDIPAEAFCKSFLHQPALFIRIRPGHEATVLEKLRKASIPFEQKENHCIAFPNTSRVDGLLEINKEAVIQDISSQRIGDFLQLVKGILLYDHKIKVWDSCAASGGKSILARDILGEIQLTVSDIRPNILHNLKARLRAANLHPVRSMIADLTRPVGIKDNRGNAEKFDLIICDAPCSGSGTWSRTPEQLHSFREQKIEKFPVLQKSIVRNCVPHLKQNGLFLYITCSVFEAEDNMVANYICQTFSMKCIRKELIEGFDQKGDSMFAALFSFEK